MKIERIRIAAEALHKAAYEEGGVTGMPSIVESLWYKAVEAIIDAVVSEIIIEIRQGER